MWQRRITHTSRHYSRKKISASLMNFLIIPNFRRKKQWEIEHGSNQVAFAHKLIEEVSLEEHFNCTVEVTLLFSSVGSRS